MNWIQLTQASDREANGERIMNALYDNRVIWIMEEIDESTVEDVTCRLLALASENAEPVKLFICSGGGSAHSTLGICDLIINSPAPVHTYALGKAWSGAAWIFACGHKRLAFPHTSLMVHPVKRWGSLDTEGVADLQEEARRMGGIQDQLFTILKERTRITAATLKRMKTDDVYFTASDALKWGVADEIVGK